MVWKSSLVLGAVLSIAACPASAQQSAEFDACTAHADGVSAKMLDCGKVEIGKWDARLNAAYQRLLHGARGREAGAIAAGAEGLAQASFERDPPAGE
ncbi:lysozyme inhibitor LprI family protein [Bradyrhizobium sp. USDA 4470]